MILLSRQMFYGQGIRWCHSFSPVTSIVQGYDLCNIILDSCFSYLEIGDQY